MIYTCTTNPSLDYYLSISKDIQKGQVNRTNSESYEAGGKGVNVSIVLNNLHIPTKALGFLGGFARDYYLSFLKKYPFLEPQFTMIEGNTRINIKIMSNDETGINAKGPYIDKKAFEKFKLRLRNIYSDDIFVLSGNVQDEIFDDMVTLIHTLSNDGVKIVLDTNLDLILKCLDTNLYLIRPDTKAVLDYFKVDDINIALQKLFSLGAKRIIMHDNDDSYLFSEDNILHSKIDDTNLINTTGTSDSMVAGYLYSIQRGASEYEAFAYANAAGLATSYSDDLASKNKIEEYFKRIRIEKLR